MKKRFLFIVIILTILTNVFSEIKWQAAEKDNENGITAYAVCNTREEVLQVTHWNSLDPYFKSYITEEDEATQDFYLIIFMNIGTIVYEYHKGTNVVGYYVKTIFE